jgi:hypothetical protein
MAFDNTLPPTPFADNGGSNFVKPSGTDFIFDADGDWMNMNAWKTFWMSTFQPNKYKEKRDKEVEDGLKERFKVTDGMSCDKLNQRIDDMEDFYDKEATSSPSGRGATRMQARNLKGIEAPLNKAYNLAEDKCCEYSVCDSNKQRGRGDDAYEEETIEENQNAEAPTGGMDEDFRNQLMEVLQQRTITTSEETPTSTKIGLGVGAVIILGGMAYLIFGK